MTKEKVTIKRVVLGSGYAEFGRVASSGIPLYISLREGLKGGHAYQCAILKVDGVEKKRIRLVAEILHD